MNQQLEEAINTFIACLGVAMHPENREFSEVYMRISELETRYFEDKNLAVIYIVFFIDRSTIMYWSVAIDKTTQHIDCPGMYNIDGRVTFDQIQAANEILCNAILDTKNELKNEPN